MNTLGWKQIEGYDGYEVCVDGRVRSVKKNEARELKQREGTSGYMMVDLRKDNKKTTRQVHRLVALTFRKNPENKKEVNHKDGNKHNNEAYNLEWVTASENQKHAIKNGFRKLGEDLSFAKLTEKQVKYIRENPARMTQQQLANMFHLKQPTVSDIITRKNWKHIK